MVDRQFGGSVSQEPIGIMSNIQDVRLEDTRVYKDIERKVRLETRQSIISHLLSKKFGEISEVSDAYITRLSLEQLETLLEDLLDFQEIADLEAWLAAKQ